MTSAIEIHTHLLGLQAERTLASIEGLAVNSAYSRLRNDLRRGGDAAQSERCETMLTSVPLGSRSMKRRTPHSSSRSE